MKKFAQLVSRVSVTLFAGLFVAFAISTALATSTPTCDPTSSSCTVVPNFSSLLVGSGTDPDDGDLKVTGNATVVGTLSTDGLASYTSGGTITSTATIAASAFGNIYIDRTVGGTAVTSSFMPFYGKYSANSSCDAGDEILGCSGYLTTLTATYYGSTITKSSTTYSCKAGASTSAVTSYAVCMSPDGGSTAGDI